MSPLGLDAVRIGALWGLMMCAGAWAMLAEERGVQDWHKALVGRVTVARSFTLDNAIAVASDKAVVAVLDAMSGDVTWRQPLEDGATINSLSFPNEAAGTLVSLSNCRRVDVWNVTDGALLGDGAIAASGHATGDGAKDAAAQCPGSHVIEFMHSSTSEDAAGKEQPPPARRAPLVVTLVNGELTVMLRRRLRAQHTVSVPGATAFTQTQLVAHSNKVYVLGVDPSAALHLRVATISVSKTKEVRVTLGEQQELSSGRVVDAFGIVGGERVVFTEVVEQVRVTNDIDFVNERSAVVDMDNVAKDFGVVGERLAVVAMPTPQSSSLVLLSDGSGGAYTHDLHTGTTTSLHQSIAVADVLALVGTVHQALALSVAKDATVFVTSDQGLLWKREESLASVVDTEFVELPHQHALIDELRAEFGNMAANPLARFLTRLSSQARMAVELLAGPTAGADLMLERDKFNIRRVIVVLTEVGKVFGLDSMTGDILWSRLFDDWTPVSSSLHLLRAANVDGARPLVAVFGLATCGESKYFLVDAITGVDLREDGVGYTPGEALGYTATQIMKLPVDTAAGSNALAVFDGAKVHFVPALTPAMTARVANVADTLHFTVMADHALSGYRATVTNESGAEAQGLASTDAVSTWVVQVPATESVAAVGQAPKYAHVGMIGEPLADQTVLHKYLNPHLHAYATIKTRQATGAEAGPTTFLSVYVVDTVKGTLMHTAVHEDAAGPVTMVALENWIVYTYWNTLEMRSEVTVLEMYQKEGADGVGSGARAGPQRWSSMLHPRPRIVAQSFIAPATVHAAAVTTTKFGITSKQVLLGLVTGKVVAVDKKLILNARRPLTQPTQEQMQEEGLMKYHPRIVIPKGQGATITTNETIYDIKGIVTAPAGLESHCHVLVHGLDMFYTLVHPSKKFDTIGDISIASLITMVAGFAVATMVTAYFSKRKVLNKAWQ